MSKVPQTNKNPNPKLIAQACNAQPPILIIPTTPPAGLEIFAERAPAAFNDFATLVAEDDFDETSCGGLVLPVGTDKNAPLGGVVPPASRNMNSDPSPLVPVHGP
ncbi:hypothetical protein HDU97_004430 [Phlyctochytrium planicorne]|nr:hypothetical protein HDU97_004430 [Phlyctochytrium planicorne]